MTELRGLQLSIEEFTERGARIIAVSPDPPEKNREVVSQLGLDFSILSDPEAMAAAAFGVEHRGGGPGGADIPRPATFVIQGGVIRSRHLTDNWRVGIRPESVLEHLDDLG